MSQNFAKNPLPVNNVYNYPTINVTGTVSQSWITGSGAPVVTGYLEGCMYYDYTNNQIYQLISGTWTLIDTLGSMSSWWVADSIASQQFQVTDGENVQFAGSGMASVSFSDPTITFNVTDAPSDGSTYGRLNGTWSAISGTSPWTISGYSSMYSSDTGSPGTSYYNFVSGYSAIGAGLLTGEKNIIVGYNAGYSMSGGSNNVFFGQLAGYYNSTGYQNIFLGYSAGNQNADGHDNICLGHYAGYALTSGYDNILIGRDTSDTLTSGYRNIAIGTDIDLQNTTGNNQLTLGNLIFGIDVDGTGTSISSGKIGIGKVPTTYRLEIDGAQSISTNLHVTGAYHDSGDSAGSSGYLLSSSGSGTTWTDPTSLVTVAIAETNSGITPIADSTYTFDVTVPNTSIAITTASGIITAITIV